MESIPPTPDRVRPPTLDAEITAQGRRADQTAAILREVLGSIGVRHEDYSRIRGAVTLSAEPYLYLGNMTLTGVQTILDALMVYRLDRMRDTTTPAEVAP